ncbi:MAG: glycoside hydrolase family 5 protein [Lachnospiraceae bacterium]|nr:glycoside hydrolase family 5 protein [Lachnospiraceae bacterium]
MMNGLKKGVNLGGWMSQCDYSKERLDHFITDRDFEKIASWGVDHVRLPIDYNVIQNEDMSFKEDGLARIEGAVALAKKHGLKLVLDLHKTLGYSFDKGEQESGFFENEKYQENFYRVWEELAGRFGSDPETVYLELLNEVTDESYLEPWNRIWKTCVARIRRIAPDSWILIGSYNYNAVSTLQYLDPPADKKMIYNFHCYEPFKFTHQGAYWTDAIDRDARPSFAESGASEAYYDELFASAIEKAEKEGVSLYCGEYGVIDVASPEDALSWFRTIHAAFEKYGIARCAWSYKEMDFGISDARMDGVRDELISVL